MNSVQTVLGWIAGKNQNGSYSVHWTLKRWYTDKTLEELWKEMGIKEYIDAYHTLGNFVLVPALFNGKRGLDSDINNFWDRSLRQLKDGFGKFKSDDFEQYVNYFFLWDYVNVAEDNKSYIPKTDLSEGLCSDKSNDEIKQQYMNFFKTATSMINRRGKFMTAMLMIQTQNPALYKDEIQTFLINDEFRAKSIFDAANQILENQELEKKIPENAKILLDELKKGKV